MPSHQRVTLMHAWRILLRVQTTEATNVADDLLCVILEMQKACRQRAHEREKEEGFYDNAPARPRAPVA